MSENIISIVLDYSKWDKNTSRWLLPNTSIIKGIKRLWINNNEILPNAFRTDNGFLELLDKSNRITPSDKITADILLTAKASMSTFSQNVILALIALVPAFLTFIATTISLRPEVKAEDKEMSHVGPPLVSYSDYPVVWNQTKRLLEIDREKFMVNVDRFLREDNYHAATDLIYLGVSNTINFTENEASNFKKMIKKYNVNQFDNIEEYKKNLFKVPETIIQGIAEMFPDTKLEMVLHDTRDPLHSVRAIANNITDRKIGSPGSNLTPELIRHYSATTLDIKPLISYKLKYKDRVFKSSSIPLYDAQFGLFGCICINFDVTDVAINPNQKYIEELIGKLSRIEMGDLGEELRRSSTED